MQAGTDSNQAPRTRPPLWSIGFAIAVTLFIPFVLYSIAPEGTIREGDTVFSNGRHMVVLAHPTEYQHAGYETTCVLELRDPLIVMNRPGEQVDAPFRAQVQGKSKLEVPFCPPQAQVLVKPHQVLQKTTELSDFVQRLTRMFSL